MNEATAIDQKQLTAFNLRLKVLRLRRGWALEDLALQSGYFKAFLFGRPPRNQPSGLVGHPFSKTFPPVPPNTTSKKE